MKGLEILTSTRMNLKIVVVKKNGEYAQYDSIYTDIKQWTISKIQGLLWSYNDQDTVVLARIEQRHRSMEQKRVQK